MCIRDSLRAALCRSTPYQVVRAVQVAPPGARTFAAASSEPKPVLEPPRDQMPMNTTLTSPRNMIADVLERLGLNEECSGASTGTKWLPGNGAVLKSVSPVDGASIGSVRGASRSEYETAIACAQEGFLAPILEGRRVSRSVESYAVSDLSLIHISEPTRPY